MYVVGHRGAAGIAPENTLLGFRTAIELGVDFVECDVHLSRDGHLVVIHDDTLDRTTDGRGPVGDKTLAELQALDAGRGERIPQLRDVLETVRGRVRLLLELKGKGVEQAALQAVRDAGMLEAVTFTSFDLGRIAGLKALEPRADIGAIFSNPGPDAAQQAKRVGASGAGVQFRRLTPDLVEQFHAQGLNVRGWNPDTVADMRSTIATGVDGVSSNRPDLLLELLAKG